MSDKITVVNGWEVRPNLDGSFSVYGDKTLMAGPFGRVLDAIEAAMKLPHPTSPLGGEGPPKGRVPS